MPHFPGLTLIARRPAVPALPRLMRRDSDLFDSRLVISILVHGVQSLPKLLYPVHNDESAVVFYQYHTLGVSMY